MSAAMKQLIEIFHALDCQESHNGEDATCDFYETIQMAEYETDELYVQWREYVEEIIVMIGFKNPEDFLTGYKKCIPVLEAFRDLPDLSHQLLFNLLSDRITEAAE